MEETEFNIRVLSLRDKMFRFARSILHQQAEAEDVTHDTLERMWVRRARLDECRDVEAFVMISVRNGCYDRLRRTSPTESDFSGLVAENTIGRSEAGEMVAKGMAGLPAKQREALHLKDIEGYENQEIAAMLSVEENQIRTILSRARKGLRKAIERMDNETDDRRD